MKIAIISLCSLLIASSSMDAANYETQTTNPTDKTLTEMPSTALLKSVNPEQLKERRASEPIQSSAIEAFLESVQQERPRAESYPTVPKPKQEANRSMPIPIFAPAAPSDGIELKTIVLFLNFFGHRLIGNHHEQLLADINDCVPRLLRNLNETLRAGPSLNSTDTASARFKYDSDFSKTDTMIQTALQVLYLLNEIVAILATEKEPPASQCKQPHELSVDDVATMLRVYCTIQEDSSAEALKAQRRLAAEFALDSEKQDRCHQYVIAELTDHYNRGTATAAITQQSLLAIIAACKNSLFKIFDKIPRFGGRLFSESKDIEAFKSKISVISCKDYRMTTDWIAGINDALELCINHTKINHHTMFSTLANSIAAQHRVTYL